MSDLSGVGEIGYGFLNTFFHEKKRDIKKFFVKNKVGFLPEGMDYSDYQDIKNNAVIKQLKHLIGKHETLPIILIGLFLQKYSGDKKREIAEKHRNEIYKRHKARGISILNMASTGFIEGFVRWLTDYNMKNNPSKAEIIDLYERNLDEWEEVTFFVQNITSMGVISKNVVGRVNSGKTTSFVFASGGAISKTESVMNNLSDELAQSGYSFDAYNLNNTSSERVWAIVKNPSDAQSE